MTIAALFVETQGIYFGLPDVDPWDQPRDARLYAGPYPVVAHPPCDRWGRYWSGGPSAKERRVLGSDAGCFASALASVQAWGGVLEHPEGSHAFRASGLPLPAWGEGWIRAGFLAGYVCCVAQGNYGHRARKLTWLYAVGTALPELDWSIPAPRARLDAGFHSAAERRSGRRRPPVEQHHGVRLRPQENLATPLAFRDVLLELARSCR